MAILAVAFVVLAAVPAALTDSDAADTNTLKLTNEVKASKVLEADPTSDYTGWWTWDDSNKVIKLGADLIIDVTVADELTATTKIDLNGYNLTIEGSAQLTMRTMATIENGTGAKSVGTFTVAADSTGGIVLTTMEGNSGITAPATFSGGKIEAKATSGATVTGDAQISGATLSGLFQFSKVTMTKGTVDYSAASTNVALNGEEITYTGGDLKSYTGEALISATKSVDATLPSSTADKTVVLTIAAQGSVEVKLKCGSAEFGATVTETGKSSPVKISYTSGAFAFETTGTGVATLSGAITGKVTMVADKTVLDTTNLIAVKGTLDASAVVKSDTALGNVAVVNSGELIVGAEITQAKGKMVKDYGGNAFYKSGDEKKPLTQYKSEEAGIENLAFTADQINSEANLRTALFAAANAKTDIAQDSDKGTVAVYYHTVELGADVTLIGDLAIPSGVTLNMATYDIAIGEGMKVVNEGTLDSNTGVLIRDTADADVFFQNNGGTVEKAIIGDAETPNTGGVTLTDVSGTFGVSYIITSKAITGTSVSGSRIIGNDGTLETTSDGSDPIAKIAASVGTLTFGKISMEKNIYLTGKTGGEADGDIILKDVTVNNGASLKLAGGTQKTKVEGTMSVYGDVSTIKANDKTQITLNVPDKATYRMYNGSTMKNITLAGAGTIDVSQAQRVSEQGQDIGESKPFGALEYVEIVGSLRVWNNADIVVYGGFTVDEGVTFTIESGSTVTINSTTAEMKIAGKVIVEEGAEFKVTNAKSVDITGEIVSEGVLDFAGGDYITTIKSGGVVVSAESDESEISVRKLAIENGGVLTVESKMTITDVQNKGTIVLDGAEMEADSTIKMSAGDASVVIEGVTGEHKLTITDDGMEFVKGKYVEEVNQVTITPNAKTTVKGLTVTEKVTSSSGSYTNKIELSGDISQTSDNDLKDQIIAVDAQKGATIPGEMELGKRIILQLGGNVSVSGTLETTVSGGSDASKVTVESEAVVDVSGLIQSENQIKPSGTLNAAEYQYEIGTSDVWRYSTLAKALEDKAENINILGTVKVTTDLTIPSGTVVKGANLIVGSSSNRDITLTVEDGGALKNSNTTVDATVYFENKKNNGTSIVSDVSIIGDVDARYTNIYTALNKAEAGDVVTITRETPVELSSDITIKEGVTLDVPISKSLKITKPITVTVNGTLKSDSDIACDATAVSGGFAVKADTTKKTAAITLGANGIVMINSPSDVKTYASQYDRYQTAGAYFHMVDSVGDYYYITSVAYAASVITETETLTVDKVSYNAVLFGTLVVGDVAFSGNSSGSVSVLYVKIDKTEMTASSITLSKATFVSEGTFTGTVSVGDSSAVLNKVSYVKATTAVTGVPYTLEVTTDKTNENSSAAISAGSVAVASADKITVESGATMNAAKAGSTITEAVVDGTVDVAAGRTMKVDTLSVNGSAIAQPASGSDGKATLEVEQLYVGVSKSEITGAAASVTGEVNVTEFAVVKEGSTIAKETSDNFGKKYTEYYVESSKWITVYDATGKKEINDITKAPVSNAYFDGTWLNADGKDVDDGVYVGADEYGKVYADIKYEIYYVEIKADQGIGDLYLNGNIMAKGFKIANNSTEYYYAYWATVKAGDYEVTCKLANGYSGTAVLKKTDGSTVTNNKFNASGNPVGDAETVELDFQLTGIAKSGYVQPSEDKDEDTGMGITDYLLIVLVILVVVLAVIVALRLMRS